MTDVYDYDVRVVADDSVRVNQFVHEVLSQLEGVDGVESVVVSRQEQEDRDISEVVDMLDGLSERDMELLLATIEYYTE